MHAFLVVCVVLQSAVIGWLWYARHRGLPPPHWFSDSVWDRFDELETKLADVTEGCERFDAELSDALLELKELSERQSASSEENSKAITDLVEMIEKMRRSRSGPIGSAAFEVTRQRAEKATYKGASKSHDELVALAEGR